MNPLRHKFLPISFGVSVIGLAFSVYNVLSTFWFAEVCTDHCGVFANFTFMGFSLWWLSTLVFAAILLLSLFGFAYLIRLITAAALFLDVFLFLVMLTTTICIMCMGVGILFAFSYYAVRYENRRPIQPYPKTVLLTVWCILFIALAGSGINAGQKAYPLVQAENATANVFFSPSCPACRQLLLAEYANKNISWYPVEENEKDIWRILYMQERLTAGDTLEQAFLKAEQAKPEEKAGLFSSFDWDYFVLQYEVWKNSAIVKRRTSFLPYTEVLGVPKTFGKPEISLQNSVPAQNTADTVAKLIGKETALCGDDSKPCDE